MYVWIDDERTPPGDGNHWHVVQSSAQAITLLTNLKNKATDRPFEVISFDHDLGYAFDEVPTWYEEELRSKGYTDDTSRPVLLWMIENDFWPSEIRFHTANPVGREWLVGMANRYAPDGVLVGR